MSAPPCIKLELDRNFILYLAYEKGLNAPEMHWLEYKNY